MTGGLPRRLTRGLAAVARKGIASLPDETRQLALSMATRAAHGPTLLPGPPPGPVLVVAPHPDDEVIGPGGTLVHHVRAGDDVRVLVVTSGGATAGGGPDVTATREAESRRALAHLGVSDLVFGRLPDGALPAHVDAVADLVAAHAEGRRTIYVPSLLDHHPDHRAAGVAVARADLPADCEVYGYEVWAAGPVDVLVDVTSVFGHKQAALGEYHTALQTVDYVRSASGLAAFRSAEGGLGGRGFAEGFTRSDTATHRALVAGVAPGHAPLTRFDPE